MTEDEPSKEELATRVNELEETVRKMLPSRRDFLKAGAGSAVTGAALLGSSGTAAAQSAASQDTSTFTVGDAGAGENGDYVVDELVDPGGDTWLNVDDTGGVNAQYGREWFFDSLSTGSVLNNIDDAKIQVSWDGLVVPVAPGLGMSDAIDPSGSTTPVQDAIDAINATATRGTVLLPPDTVQNNSPLSDTGNVNIRGWGAWPGSGGSTVEMTDTSSPGILADGTYEELHRSHWDGFVFDGSDVSARESGNGNAVYVNTNGPHPANWNIGTVTWTNWPGPAITFANGHVYDFVWEHLHALNMTGPFLEFDDGGPSAEIGAITGTPNGEALRFVEPTMFLNIGTINVGNLSNNPNRAILIDAHESDHLTIDNINVEPVNAGAVNSAVRLRGSGSTTIEYVNYQGNGGTIDAVVLAQGGVTNPPARKTVGRADINNASATEGLFSNGDANGENMVYRGPSGDVFSVSTNSGKNGVFCVADQTRVS